MAVMTTPTHATSLQMEGAVVTPETLSAIVTPKANYEMDSEEENEVTIKRPLWEKVLRGIGWTVAVLAALYVFMVGIKIMGSAFQVLMGCNAGQLFEFTNNPIAGLMVGILVTVLVQSSSTSTSIVVSLVGAGALTVEQAVPIIMGANIGTTVTSTMVAFAQIGNKAEFERAFAAATLHDMFNVLSVAVLLPLQVATEFISKLAELIVGDGIATEGEEMASPLDAVVKPVANWFVQVDKSVISDSASGAVQCSDVDTIMKGGIFYGKMSDPVAGTLLLIISLVMMMGALMVLVKILNYLLRDASETILNKALGLNGYLNIIIGAGVTFVVQSSSIVTSVLTPLVGVGAVTLPQMYPLVLGANLGTTGTAFLAAMVSASDDSVAVALCHLIFNICGILLWYPIPVLRRIPIYLATVQGWVAARWNFYPVAYLITLFAVVPAVLIVLSVMYGSDSGVMLGIAIAVTILLALAIAGLAFWFFGMGGKAQTIAWLESKEKSEKEVDRNSHLERISNLSIVSVVTPKAFDGKSAEDKVIGIGAEQV